MPRQAPVRVSADARYTLYVNGRRVHFGPARSFPQHQSYDTLDLARALVVGRNAICAIVHQIGVPTYQSVYRDTSGFLLDGVIELEPQAISLHTPDEWLCRESRAWRKNTARLSVQLGFQEHFDAGAEDADWMQPGYVPDEERGWRKPHVVGPVGVYPWLEMEERGVPLLGEQMHSFVAVAAQFRGSNAPGYESAEDVYRLAAAEKRQPDNSAIENPGAMLADDAAVTSIRPASGGFAMAVLDLGKNRSGHVVLDIAQAAGGEIVDILYTESQDRDGGPALLGDARGHEEATADRYRCRAGPQRWEPFFMKGLRYATLVFRNLSSPLKLRHVGFRQVHAAVEEVGAFECSDGKLNEIWLAARETLRNCMFDAYVDCPWRGQAQWWGDARIQFRANAYSFGDITLLERGIRQVAQSQGPDGALHAHPPADINDRLPDCMLSWAGTLWEHYFHTGRLDVLREHAAGMNRLFDFFARHELRDGLIGGFDGFRVFLDRADLYRSDFSAVLNLMYLQGLRWAAAICHVLGDACASAYERKATALEAAIERHFFDPSAKLWRDGFDPRANAPIESVSQHANALAILLDLRPETHASIARNVLLKSATARRGKMLTASPCFYAYVLEALFEAGLRQQAIDLIRAKWAGMLDSGATTFWETWDATNESRCHGGAASPLYLLSQHVLGVMPVDVGWKQVRIAPLSAGLEYARGQVPSPLGAIRVEWEKAGEDQLALHVELPKGMTAEFVGPLGETRNLAAGSHEFHT